MKRITLLLLVLVFLLTSCEPPKPQMATNSLIASNSSSLGNYLEFPDGWTPVLFTDYSREGVYGRTTSFIFICERDGVYRECTPRVVSGSNNE